jgi:hypothetical protein
MVTKAISFIIESEHNKLSKIHYEYPEIEKLTSEGWVLMDTLPVCSNGKNYLVTFILGKEDEPVRKKKSQ